MDRGVWISWYDLDEAHRAEYLSWLHERYLPGIMKRPGIVWAAHYAAEPGPPPARLNHTTDASIPTGGDYILLIGAESAHAFSPPHPREKFEDVTEADKKMRARRVRERVSIMTEEARGQGPAAARDQAPGLSRCIQLGTFNAGPTRADEDELLAWYARWRIPCMEKLPGLVRVRKLVGVTGWARHGVLYEFTSLAERNQYFPTHEKPFPELEAWTDKVVCRLVHAPRSPQVAQRLWPA
jgi:hypothetical protein